MKVKVLVTQWCLILCESMDYSLLGSSVHGILQARILEWVAMPFSQGSSQTQASHIMGRFCTIWAAQEAYMFSCMGLDYVMVLSFTEVKNLPAMQEMWVQSVGQKIPWRRKLQHTPVFLPRKVHRQRSLAGYSPWGHKKSRTWLNDQTTTNLSQIYWKFFSWKDIEFFHILCLHLLRWLCNLYPSFCWCGLLHFFICRCWTTFASVEYISHNHGIQFAYIFWGFCILNLNVHQGYWPVISFL